MVYLQPNVFNFFFKSIYLKNIYHYKKKDCSTPNFILQLHAVYVIFTYINDLMAQLLLLQPQRIG